MLVNLPTGSAHVLNSKLLVSEPCKQFCFCCKIDPKHVKNFTEHNFRHFFKILHQGSHTRIAHTLNILQNLYICSRTVCNFISMTVNNNQ